MPPVRLKNPLATTRLSLASPLEPDRCTDALLSRVQAPSFGSQGPVLGRVATREFLLWMAIGYRNSFQTQAKGTLVPLQGGTRVDVTLGLSGSVRGLLVAMAVFMALLEGTFLFGLSRGPTPLVMTVGFVSMPVFFVALVFFGRWLARGEQSSLVSFLCETLQARIVESSVRVSEAGAYRTAAPDPALEELEDERETEQGTSRTARRRS